jgi:hypothetical protein
MKKLNKVVIPIFIIGYMFVMIFIGFLSKPKEKESKVEIINNEFYIDSEATGVYASRIYDKNDK